MMLITPALAAIVTTTNPYVTQDKSLWCWAASSTSVLRINGYSSQTQAAFVQTVKGNTLDQTNLPHGTIAAWKTHYNLSTTSAYNTLSFASIKNIISSGAVRQPIFCQVLWSTGGGHDVVISGYNDTNDDLRIMDPGLSTWSWCTRSNFVNGGYLGSGSWSFYAYVI
jgi:hypothetical protein